MLRVQVSGCVDRSASTVVSSRVVENAVLMSQSRLFAGLSHSDCMALAGFASVKDFSRSDFLFEQGQPLRSVILILKGCVKLTQLSSDGSEVILWLRGSGDAVGVFGIPARGNHSCSAQVVVKCRALVWEWTRLDRAPASSQIRSNIGHIVSERLGELEERFREIATERVSRRVACAIARIVRQIGTVSQEGVEITLSREELAQLTGTTLFTVSRLFSKWSELGVVTPRREGFVVRNPERLLDVSLAGE